MKAIYLALLTVVAVATMSACVVVPGDGTVNSCGYGFYDGAVTFNVTYDAGPKYVDSASATIYDPNLYVTVYDSVCDWDYKALCSGVVTFSGCLDSACDAMDFSDFTRETLECSYVACDFQYVTVAQSFDFPAGYVQEVCTFGSKEPGMSNSTQKEEPGKAFSEAAFGINAKAQNAKIDSGKRTSTKATAEQIKAYEAGKVSVSTQK